RDRRGPLQCARDPDEHGCPGDPRPPREGGAERGGAETEHDAGNDKCAGSHRRVTERSASMIAVGSGGHPGIEMSTGTTSLTAPTTPYPPRKTPQSRAQSPTAMITRGCGVASTVFMRGTTMFWVTGPVPSPPAAWRGGATRPAPEAFCVIDGAE